MKTFLKSTAVFLIFLAGTLSVIHVDRQCQEMEGGGVTIMEEIETAVGAAVERADSLK